MTRPGFGVGLGLATTTAAMCLAAACTGSPTPPPEPDPNDEGTKVAFDPADFVDPTLDTNPYHPLTPGMQWVRGRHHRGGLTRGAARDHHDDDRRHPGHRRGADDRDARRVDRLQRGLAGRHGLPGSRQGRQRLDPRRLHRGVRGRRVHQHRGRLARLCRRVRPGILAPADGHDGHAALVHRCRARGEGVGRSSRSRSASGSASSSAASTTSGSSQEGEVGAPDNENKSYAPGVGVINNVPLDASLHQDASSCSTSSS